MGAVSEEEYWCVPKTNFPNGLPDAIKEYLVDPNTFDYGSNENCSKFGSDNFYAVDKAIPRTSLGKGVTTLKFYAGNSTKCNLNPRQPSEASSGAIASDDQFRDCSLSCCRQW